MKFPTSHAYTHKPRGGGSILEAAERYGSSRDMHKLYEELTYVYSSSVCTIYVLLRLGSDHPSVLACRNGAPDGEDQDGDFQLYGQEYIKNLSPQ